jgi:predicted hydrolase (HD superfamily)
VRPDGIETLEPKSVKKKLKQPSFAAGRHREDVYKGAEELGVELDDHIASSSRRCARSRASSGYDSPPSSRSRSSSLVQ